MRFDRCHVCAFGGILHDTHFNQITYIRGAHTRLLSRIQFMFEWKSVFSLTDKGDACLISTDFVSPDEGGLILIFSDSKNILGCIARSVLKKSESILPTVRSRKASTSRRVTTSGKRGQPSCSSNNVQPRAKMSIGVDQRSPPVFRL